MKFFDMAWVADHRWWIAFHVALVILLAIELTFTRWGMKRLDPEAKARRQHRNAVIATVMWVVAALGLAALIWHGMGATAGTQFLAGYAIEEALSVDNLFLFLLLFRVFQIAPAYQPKALFWGVLGAIVLRGGFIAAGLGLLERFAWVQYGFAVILLIAAVRLVFPGEHGEPETAKPPAWTRWISKIHPVSLRSDVFFTREEGKPRVTMLFLALIAIEAADIVFALDSIPAVLSITRQPLIAYTSNILAVMGLRSLFFLLAHMLRRLRYLHLGLAVILGFAAMKMLLVKVWEVGPVMSLGVIVVVLAITVGISLRPVEG